MARRRVRSTAPARAGRGAGRGAVVSAVRAPTGARGAAAAPRRSDGRRPRPCGGRCTKGGRRAPCTRKRPDAQRHTLRSGRVRSRRPGCPSGDTRGRVVRSGVPPPLRTPTGSPRSSDLRTLHSRVEDRPARRAQKKLPDGQLAVRQLKRHMGGIRRVGRMSAVPPHPCGPTLFCRSVRTAAGKTTRRRLVAPLPSRALRRRRTKSSRDRSSGDSSGRVAAARKKPAPANARKFLTWLDRWRSARTVHRSGPQPR
jgi:hypothetical protein